jgi:site-specific DNA-adenine methylase
MPEGIAYPGGKARLAGRIVSFLPPQGNLYVEPFAGRGNVFWSVGRILPYKHWWLNDIHTAPFFNAVKSIGGGVAIPHRTRGEYTRQKLSFPCAKALILEPYLTFAGAGYEQAGSQSLCGAVSRAGYEARIRQCHRLLLRTKARITGLNWSEMGLQKLTSDDIVYFDPPYKGSNVGCYQSSDVDHEQLVEALLSAKYRWVLSEYDDPLYLSHLGEPFFAHDVRVLFGENRQTRTECLWRNF